MDLKALLGEIEKDVTDALGSVNAAPTPQPQPTPAPTPAPAPAPAPAPTPAPASQPAPKQPRHPQRHPAPTPAPAPQPRHPQRHPAPSPAETALVTQIDSLLDQVIAATKQLADVTDRQHIQAAMDIADDAADLRRAFDSVF